MTLREIAARLEAIARLWPSNSESPRLSEIERLQLDIERHILKTEGTL